MTNLNLLRVATTLLALQGIYVAACAECACLASQPGVETLVEFRTEPSSSLVRFLACGKNAATKTQSVKVIARPERPAPPPTRGSGVLSWLAADGSVPDVVVRHRQQELKYGS